MTSSPQPRDTLAVVVGIERYTTGSQWNLDGPASDAGRFTAWLLSCGVPAERILLHVAPLPGNEHVAGAVDAVEPTEERLRRVFTETVRAMPASQLVVFWGGHGVVDGKGAKRLFTADASLADKRNLDLDSLLRSLASTYYPAHRQQLVIVDACQTLASSLRSVNLLPRSEFPRQEAFAQGRRQHLLMAARPGQAADNLDSEKTGLFSKHVLTTLATHGWPIDPDELFADVRRRITDPRDGGLGQQTPVHYILRSPDTEITTMGAPRPSARQPATRHMPLERLAELTTAMRGVDELLDDVNRQALLLLLPSDIRGAVPYATAGHLQLINLVRTCERFDHGRQALVDMFAFGLMPSPARDRLLQLMDSHWPASGC